MLHLESAPGEPPALESAGRRLRRLQTALRLWDDAEPSLAPVAWARTDGGPWLSVPLATGLRRMDGDCLLTPEEEDPLRAFCALIARRTPRAGELAWALRRFELGCERSSPWEALSDWLLAGRALLGDAETGADDRMCDRLAAICAAPEERDGLARRLRDTVALERSAIAGRLQSDPGLESLVEDLGSHLRAILRDVLCGHLDPALRTLADGLLTEQPAEPTAF